VIDSEGKRLLSRRVANDEADLLELISQVLGMAEETTWAVDMITGGAALLLALLVAHGQQVLYISSTMVNRASDGYRGQGKTDARDAAVIADQARMRRGLTPLRVDEELIVELRMLVARRQDLVADRTRMVNRLREQLLTLCPALERALDVTNKGPLTLLTRHQRPAQIRELGYGRADGVASGPQGQGCRGPGRQGRRSSRIPDHHIAGRADGRVASGPARGGGDHPQRADQDHRATRRGPVSPLRTRRSDPEHAGHRILGAEFLAATDGDMSVFASADHLAVYAGLAPAPPLQPRPEPGLLHIGAGQHPTQPRLPALL